MFLITLKQVGIMVGYIFLGYILCRKKIVGKEASKFLSKLLIYVIGPCYSVSTLSKQISLDKILDYIVIIAAGAVVALLVVFLAIAISHFFTEDSFEKRMYKYVFAFSNIGYFGYLLISAIYGEQVLASFMLFALPINIAISSYGFYVLTSSGEEVIEDKAKLRKERLKKIFSIPLISQLVAIVLGLLPFTIPKIVYDVITPAANCYSGCAMWLVGIALGSYSLKELFLAPKPYFAGLIRLLLIPLIMGGLAWGLQLLIGFDEIIVTFVVAFTCLPAGMNVVVYPESVGQDGSLGAKSCIVSYIMGLASIPLWFYLLTILI